VHSSSKFLDTVRREEHYLRIAFKPSEVQSTTEKLY